MHSTQGHPLEALREKLKALNLPDSDEVRRRRDGSYCSFAGLVICRQRPGTANGVIFITLEDERGFVNLIIWQNVYERFKDILLSLTLLGVRGKIQSKDGTMHLVVDECFDPPISFNETGIQSRDFR